MELIQPETMPKPLGHYSHATVHNGLVFVSGQVPIVPSTGELVSDDIKEQTHQVLLNAQAVTEAAGSGIAKLLKATIYISEPEFWGPVNEVYS